MPRDCWSMATISTPRRRARTTPCSMSPRRCLRSWPSHTASSGVIAGFGWEYAKTGRLGSKFHRWLIDAHDLRSVADYTAETAITREKVRAVCGWVEEFLSAARE